MNTAQRKIVLIWLPVWVLCAVIFIQSSFPSPAFGLTLPLKDKAIHMAVYGVLAALFYRACRGTWPGRLSPVQLILISICFASLYGMSDEFHQSFVASRQADVMDWVADVAGSVLGALGYTWVTSRGGRNGLPKTGY